MHPYDMSSLRTTADIPQPVIFIERLAELIGKRPTTIRTCATNQKYYHLIPPPIRMPNSRRLAWRIEDVEAWLAASTTVHPPTRPRRGPPSKAERIEAERAGLTVKEWRARRGAK